MIGSTAGEIAASKRKTFKIGDCVVGIGGWQQYDVVDASMLRKVDTSRPSALGLPTFPTEIIELIRRADYNLMPSC